MAEVNLSQESYDELLKDIKALRLQADTYFEQWQDAKRKAEAFDEIKVNLYHVKDLKPWETLDEKDHEFLRDIFNEIPSDWERGSDVEV